MKLTVSCQICGTILTVVQNDNITIFSNEDIEMYENGCYCNVVTDGVVDGQQNITATQTQDE